MIETDTVVLGVGGMGAALMDALSARGVDVVGVEQHAIAHEQGSSSGGTRVIRTAYFESPRYIPLLQRAWTLWRALAAETPGAPLVEERGVLNIAEPDHPAMRTLLEGARVHALPHEVLDATTVAARTPLRPGSGQVGFFEPQGGFLRVERCTQTFVARATARGARLLTGRAVVDVEVASPLRVNLRLEGGEEVRARRTVVAAGAWSGTRDATRALFSDVPLRVARQPQLWWSARDDAEAARLPPFIHFVEGAAFYGIPPVDGRGIKVCRHHAGAAAEPDTLDRTVNDDDTAPVRDFIRAHLPVADGPLADGRVCMYTNTPDEHFVVGPHPTHENVMRVSACSGHGYKMVIVLAEAVAELFVDGRTRHDLSLFDPRRFSGDAE